MKIKSAISLLLIAIAIISCQTETKQNTNNSQSSDLYSQESYKTIADTIITDVVIKNPDQDEWTAYCLRNFKKESFVNELFDLVYSGKLQPYDFFQETEMTIEEVKEIEKEIGYDRYNIGKVQFEEAWYFDAENQKMLKKVISIMLAYELYDADGNLKGYKPVFKVYFNDK